MSTINPFERGGYDPSIYKTVEDNYTEGKTYCIQKWRWNYKPGQPSEKEILLSIDCPVLDDFNRELWDVFSAFVSEHSDSLLWPALGIFHKNPYKPRQVFYDGYVFALCSREFKEIIENANVSRFLSLLTHFNYNHDFLIKE